MGLTARTGRRAIGILYSETICDIINMCNSFIIVHFVDARKIIDANHVFQFHVECKLDVQEDGKMSDLHQAKHT